MYRSYYGLKLKPFSITPDPKFLYMSPGHKEALAHLLYGLKEASGFVVITGEVGTGKTTILNAFLLKLPPRMPKVVVKNPHIRPENLYFLLGEAIGLPEDKRSRDHIQEYEGRLKTIGGAVLIVDEAQGLSLEMLEEIRLLSNLETTNEKLVQIMLLGQQELNEKLRSPQLRQLKQRIGIKYHIPPLDGSETRDYIDHRLRVAGYEPRERPLFTVSALSEVYRYTRGFPRLINIVCDSVLISAYTENQKQITAQMVRKVVSELESTYSPKTGGRQPTLKTAAPQADVRTWLMRAGSILVVVLALAGAVWLFSPGSPEAPVSAQDEPATDHAVSGVQEAGPQPEAQREARETRTETGPSSLREEPEKAASAAPPARSSRSRAEASAAGSTRETTEAAPARPAGREAASSPPVGRQTALIDPVQEFKQEDFKLKDEEGSSGHPVPPSLVEPAKPQGTVVVVQLGDTVAQLAADYYGRFDGEILRAVKQANPDLRNVDLIYEGQKIFLPQVNIAPQVIYSVSVASYHSMNEAKAVFLDLIGKGYEATIYPYLDDNRNTWYRITIGTFTERQDAIDYAKELLGKGFFYARPVKVSTEE
jgi:type II secretory pathway predicted ATPase ExeA/phage tail protein X